ncbi:carbohydrate kinase family protein [Bacillus sp. FJAT-29937]|uniref:carbohydrate kinase family protein n=1 Tax=Bacillus sp. FJAT-29937 TaxID=1720553 RepID=UPI0008307D86|nr:carbohydrate kinase family protein [Bacillus sp. FJAT-29937]
MVKVAVHGFINADLIGLIDGFAEIDQEVEGKELQIAPGGSAANVAVGLSRLGEEVYFLGAVGEESYTSFLLNSLEKVKLDYIQKIQGKTSGTVMVLVNNAGLRTMYTFPGANSHYDADLVPRGFFESISLLHISSPVINLAPSLFRWKEECPDLRISFDPSTLLTKKGLPFLEPLLSKTDILFVNRSEINDLFPNQDLDHSIKSLHDLGVGNIFVKLGKEGALSSFITEGRGYSQLALPSIKVHPVDSTGAGDAFAVGALYGIIRNWSQEEILRAGIKLGSSAVSEVGARKGLPHFLEREV